MNIIELCKAKEEEIPCESKEKASMNNFPNILETVINDWQQNKRKNERNQFFDAYKEIAYSLNIHPQTVRKYVNTYNPSFPPVNTLVAMCRIMGDYRPIQYLAETVK